MGWARQSTSSGVAVCLALNRQAAMDSTELVRVKFKTAVAQGLEDSAHSRKELGRREDTEYSREAGRSVRTRELDGEKCERDRETHSTGMGSNSVVRSLGKTLCEKGTL